MKLVFVMHFSILEILNIVTTQEIPTLTITSSKLALLPLYLCIWWYVWVSHHPQHWSLGWYQTASAGMKQQAVQSADWSTMDSTASAPLFCCGFRYLITWIRLKVRSNILCITNSYHTLLFQKKNEIFVLCSPNFFCS